MKTTYSQHPKHATRTTFITKCSFYCIADWRKLHYRVAFLSPLLLCCYSYNYTSRKSLRPSVWRQSCAPGASLPMCCRWEREREKRWGRWRRLGRTRIIIMWIGRSWGAERRRRVLRGSNGEETVTEELLPYAHFTPGGSDCTSVCHHSSTLETTWHM